MLKIHEKIESILSGYIEAALFTTRDETGETGGEFLDYGRDRDDIHADTLETMRNDCMTFYLQNAETIDRAVENSSFSDYEQVGIDFWLDRCGHGTGARDRGYNETDALALEYAASEYRPFDLWIGDHVVYGADGMIHGERV